MLNFIIYCYAEYQILNLIFYFEMIINVEIIILSSQFINPAKYEVVTVYQTALFESITFNNRNRVTQRIHS